jgi:hypothetical protein
MSDRHKAREVSLRAFGMTVQNLIDHLQQIPDKNALVAVIGDRNELNLAGTPIYAKAYTSGVGLSLYRTGSTSETSHYIVYI